MKESIMANSEIIIDWNEVSTELWKNGLLQDCVTITDNDLDLTINLLNVPTVIKQAIDQCINCKS